MMIAKASPPASNAGQTLDDALADCRRNLQYQATLRAHGALSAPRLNPDGAGAEAPLDEFANISLSEALRITRLNLDYQATVRAHVGGRLR